MPKGKVALVRVAYEEVPKPKPVVVRVAYEASKNLEQRVIAAVPVAVKFRKQPTRALEATAYHEAGHAVAAVEFNLGLRMATIEPEEDSLGHDHIGHPPAHCYWDKEAFNEYRARRYAEAGIQMDFAGHIAECRFLGKRALRYTWSGDLNNVIQTWMSMLRRSSHESQVAWV